jgi:hypothetical protein
MISMNNPVPTKVLTIRERLSGVWEDTSIPTKVHDIRERMDGIYWVLQISLVKISKKIDFMGRYNWRFPK